MSAVAGQCPPADELDRLLSEQLDETQRAFLETHIEFCSTCQDRLERRVGTPEALSAVLAAGKPEEACAEPNDAFLDRLKELPRVGLPSKLTADWLANGRLGQYEIIGKLGQGGMGTVYKARHIELDKVVAVKVLPTAEMHEVNVARFKREVRAIGRLEHPNIVAAHDAGQAQGVHFLVMAYVDGVDLAELVARQGPLRIADACELARQGAIGLQHTVERDLVHRDVKPSNLMLARDGLVKLLDLGLARSAGEIPANTLTMTGTLLGTADYLAPEQWDRPHAVDARADIYSLGCTLYFLLAGRPPFAEAAYQNVLAKMQAHQQLPPPPITQFRPDVPVPLAAIIARMLAKAPADRFAAPAEIATALEAFTAGADLPRLLRKHATLPTSSSPSADTVTPCQAVLDTSSIRPLPKPVTRSYPLIGMISAVAALAAACLFWSAWQFIPGVGGLWEPAAKSLAIVDAQVTHWEKKQLLGDLATSSRAVRVEDGVQITARLSAPAYYYVIAFNPKGSEDGTEQLCYPSDKDGRKEPSSAPVRSADLQYPMGDNSFVTDARGLQVLVIAASTKPLPAYAEWRKRAGTIPWTGPREGGSWRGQFDGYAFTRFPRVRGRIEPRESIPRPLRELCEFFEGRAEFEAIYAVAFPVTGERK